MTELAEKHRRVVRILDRAGLDAVIFRDPRTIAWYTGGARAQVVESQTEGVFDLVVRRDGVEVVTDRIEADRLRSEELAGLEASWTVVDWTGPRDKALPSGERIGSDSGLPGRASIGPQLVAARRRLLPVEIERYRRLGADAAEAFTDTALAAQPSMSEWQLAAELAGRLLERGIVPVVLLVGGGDRLATVRHPLPTAARLDGAAMIVACGRRDGLIANLTRLISFGPPEAKTLDAYRRLLRVEAAFLRASRPRVRLGEAFARGIRAYAANGFRRDEWRHHHQGGPTGYATRDEIATRDSETVLESGQAVAWNPSAPGLKVEDTIVVRPARPEVLTVDPRWPVEKAGGLTRPGILAL